MSDSNLKQTPLHAEHRAAGARMVPFAGFRMPIQYEGIRAEHRAVRERAGLFDVSHMGEFEIRGDQALKLVQQVTVNDASTLEPGQAQYSALCNARGGVVDDLLVYRRDHGFMLVVNAANREKDLAWIRKHGHGFDAVVEDRSDRIALLALQGPRAAEILGPLTPVELDDVKYYRFTEDEVGGASGIISRTGYTGEDGFELYVDADDAPELWRRVLEAGEPAGLVPAGLGARDSLRLEMGYALYGNDLDEDHTALESGLGWIVKLDKGDFVGRRALAEQKREGVERKLVGLRLTEKGFPRPGYPVVHGDEAVGTVTSGTVSPSLEVGVALGYVPAELAAPDTEVGIRIRKEVAAAVVQRPPFYTDGSIQR